MPAESHTLTAILPCTDVARGRAFYARLGFTRAFGDELYLMLDDGRGGQLHLRPVSAGSLTPSRNPFGLYLYCENVDALAAEFAGEILGDTGGPEHKPWGMYEFALSDPDGVLVRIGWFSPPEVVGTSIRADV